MGNRPSNKEIINKVTEGLAALKEGRFQIGLTKHLVADLEELELESENELIPLLIELLSELQSAGPVESYKGGRPPQRSYEPEIRDQELWAYAWHSQRLGRQMYLKFVLRKSWYIYVDCHEDRPKGN